MSGKPVLVYGIVKRNLVLLPESVAQAYAHDHEHIWALTTFGDARRFEPQGLNVAPGLDEDDYDDLPSDEDPYDAASTTECLNGDWPPAAATIALGNMLDDLDDIGEERENLGGVPFLYIDPADEQQLTITLRDRGYQVARRDDELIRRIEPYA